MKRLYFDLETSQMVVKTFSLYPDSIQPSAILKHSKVICASWKWEGKDKVHNLTWNEDQCDKRVIEALLLEMGKADEIVAHNGDRFDIKWINTRCVFHKIDAVPEWKTVDTLKIAKKYLKLPSNRLDAIGDYFGIGRKIVTPKGLWDRVEDGCKESLKEMVEYCDQDVLLLEDVYQELLKFLPYNKTHMAVKMTGERWGCPHCGSLNVVQNKEKYSKAGIRQFEILCKGCRKYYTISNSVWRTWQIWKIDQKNKLH